MNQENDKQDHNEAKTKVSMESTISDLEQKELSLSFEFSLIPMKTLEKSLSADKPLISLRLPGCKILPIECKILASLQKLKTLTLLDLSNNPIKLPGLFYLINPKISTLTNL